MSFHQIDDDTLLAYADGALDPARQAEVAALLEQAPELAADLDALKRLQRGLRSTFDAADLLSTPGPASWERIRQRTARRAWQRLGIALGAGACVLIVLIFATLVLRYSEQTGTTAAPTMTGGAYPVPAPTAEAQIYPTPVYPIVTAESIPTAGPPIAVTTMTDSAYPVPAPTAEDGPSPIPSDGRPTTVPIWPNLTAITGTLPIGRIVFAEGPGMVGNGDDPCWGIFAASLELRPTPDPDRALEEGSPIFVLNAGDRQPTHIADGCVPALSPDGKRVAYSKNGDIFVINADGSQNTRVTNEPARDSFPTWSPDGQRIAFARDRDGIMYLYVMSADGSGQTQLTASSINVLPGLHYSWSPDGQRIAFTVQRGVDASIYVVNADGSRLTELPRHFKRDFWPAWSPDGKKIAFLSEDCCDPDPSPTPGGPPMTGLVRDGCCGGNIYVMNADGSEQTEITTMGDGPPVWSPDGSSIAFISIRDMIDRFADIYVMTADGRQQTRLVTIGAGGPLAWSPDGQYIIFKAWKITGDDWRDWTRLVVVKLDGSQLIQLPFKNYTDLTWSQ